MKTSTKIVAGIAAVAVAGMIIYKVRKKNTGNMLSKVAEEGYETAHDVLFPTKSNRGRNLRYGPVLPI